MNTIDRLIDYDRWANQRITEAVLGLPHDQRERVARLFAHIANAMRVWHDRIVAIDVAPEPWREMSVEEAAAEIATYTEQLVGLIRLKNRQLRQGIAYRTMDGIDYQTPLIDILQHLAFHSHYHRGQINAAIRQAGGAPVNVDFIAYQREHAK